MTTPKKKHIEVKASDLPKLLPEEFERIDKMLRESSSNPIAQALAKQKTDDYYLNEWITTVPVISLVIQAVPTIECFRQDSDPPQMPVKWAFSRKEPHLESVELCRATASN